MCNICDLAVVRDSRTSYKGLIYTYSSFSNIHHYWFLSLTMISKTFPISKLKNITLLETQEPLEVRRK